MFALGAAGPSGISVVVPTFAILCSTAGPVCLSEGAYNGGGAGAAVPLPLLPPGLLSVQAGRLDWEE